MKTRAISASILLLLVVACAGAQELNPQLAEVSNALECLRTRNMSQWTRERVEPFTGGRDVLVEFWSLWGRRVKLSFMAYASDEEARKAVQDFAASTKAKRVEGINDEAYSWGYSDDVGLKRGKLAVWISAVSTAKPVMSGLDKDEILAYEREDQRKVNKSFARILSEMFSDLPAACHPALPYRYEKF